MKQLRLCMESLGDRARGEDQRWEGQKKKNGCCGAAQRIQGGRGGGNRKPHLDVALPRGGHTTDLCSFNMRKDSHSRVLSLKSQQAVEE